MKGRMLAALAVTVLAGSVQVESGGKVSQLALGESRVFGADGDRPRGDDREQPPPGPRRRPEFGVVGMMLAHSRELNLTDEQVKKLDAIKVEILEHKAAMDGDQKLRDLHDQFGAALMTRDETAVKQARIAVQSREEEIRQSLKPPSNPQEVLTDSQRTLMREIMEMNRPPHQTGDLNGPPRRDGPDGPPNDGYGPQPQDDGAPPPPRGIRPPHPQGEGPLPNNRQPQKGAENSTPLPPPQDQQNRPARLDDG